ncbi:MAG: hypothetical protein RL761_309 [Pseudomonadota bacterium]
MQPKFNSRALFACVCLLLASPAWAHGSDASPFWGGMLHIVMSPLALAALLGLVAALFGVNEDLCPSAAGVACVSAAGMAVLGASHVSLAASLAPVGVLLVGAAGLAGWRQTRPAALALALFAGCVIGLAAQLDNPLWQSVLGLALCVGAMVVLPLLAFKEVKRFPKLQKIVPIARRVLGSWVMAMGLLLTVLSLHKV